MVYQLQKSNLVPVFINVVTGPEKGVYLKNYGYLMSIREI